MAGGCVLQRVYGLQPVQGAAADELTEGEGGDEQGLVAACRVGGVTRRTSRANAAAR